jgi:S1-C subfamily serine protease
VVLDPVNDLAVLRVGGLSARALSLAPEGAARSGTPAAVLGYPENGPYQVAPARLGRTQVVISQDAYGHGPVRREVVALRGRVRSGNSGGPVVDRAGRVVGTIFAATTGGGPRGGYAVPNDVVRRALARAGEPVSSGPCTR